MEMPYFKTLHEFIVRDIASNLKSSSYKKDQIILAKGEYC